MCQAFVLSFLAHTGTVRYWHVFILSALYGITQTVDMPTRHSFFYELVGKDDIMNAVSLNSTSANLAKITGPAISGAVMVAFGPSICFLINGISYIAVLFGIFMIRVGPRTCGVASGAPMLQKVKEGVSYIRKSEILVINVIVMSAVCTFAMNNDVVVPVFSSVVFQGGASGYTTLLSAAGFGSFCGAIYMVLASKSGLHKFYLIGAALSTATLQMLTIFTKNYFVCMALVAGAGFATLFFSIRRTRFFRFIRPTNTAAAS
jgi:predicted MFS family arabinose efflux permease